MTLADALATSPNTAFVRSGGPDRPGQGRRHVRPAGDEGLPARRRRCRSGVRRDRHRLRGPDHPADASRPSPSACPRSARWNWPTSAPRSSPTASGARRRRSSRSPTATGKLLTWKQQDVPGSGQPRPGAHPVDRHGRRPVRPDGTSHAAATAAGWNRDRGRQDRHHPGLQVLGLPRASPRSTPAPSSPGTTCPGPSRSARTRCVPAPPTRPRARQGHERRIDTGGQTWLAAMKPLHDGLPNADFSPPTPRVPAGWHRRRRCRR